eukprot:GILJ01007782.1.p1 GENE.GILJ01007782.1~~GILJ01007782.1.p1  ORF type:complete len:445 (-),score=65.33 GILJ01007782.1:16-1305(-)
MEGEVVRRPRALPSKKLGHQIPDDILNNAELNAAISQLPNNYSFELHKTVWRIREAAATKVAIQFPEGLLMYACLISDILEEFAHVETLIMGDVTYGACCVDDFSARAMGCDFMVHYGHSCLIPIDQTTIKTLYVFVDIGIDVVHLVDTIKLNFQPDVKFALMGTIQFNTAIHAAKKELQDYFADIVVPQSKPLSSGEVLGCTSPQLQDRQAVVFIADGRFHLESAMIHNPGVAFYRYDPYPKLLTIEQYDTDRMKSVRQQAISKASNAQKVGLILGTLGRQGSPNILKELQAVLDSKNIEHFVLLLSEIFPQKLAMFKDVDAWVQVACPRLSIDWGYAFEKPLLSPYEAHVAFANATWKEVYPMDFYSKDGGAWTVYAANRKAAAASGEGVVVSQNTSRARAVGDTVRTSRPHIDIQLETVNSTSNLK